MQLQTSLVLGTLVVGGGRAFTWTRCLPSLASRRLGLHQVTKVDSLCENLDLYFQNVVTKTSKVKVAQSATTGRMGLVATKPIKKDEVLLAIPYDDTVMLTADVARNVVFKEMLPDKFEGWTGDAGLIALLILNQVARVASQGIPLPKRTPELDALLEAWILALPSPDEMKTLHPIMWSEGDQEVLQSSSTTKLYQILDDIEEDFLWLAERLFQDKQKFPETVSWNGRVIPCFTLQGFQWAMSLAQSRTFFVDGCLRLIPVMDMCNHSDDAQEVQGAYMGTFGTTPGSKIVASQSYRVGDEVFCSYGPKSAANYILEHGFCPPQCWKTALAALTFEIDPEDRFYDDKLDILEYETYDQPMDPVQSFDVISDGEPDPAMMQFVRFCKLGATDAFLLESIFRKEVWGFMRMPVSEANELKVVNAIAVACQEAIKDLEQCPKGGPEICAQLRECETRALSKTLGYLQREKEALDLKEYYQERRLKDLGLDSEWSPEDSDDRAPDLGYGQKRAPGGSGFDF